MTKTDDILAKQKRYLWPNHLLYYTDPIPLDHGDGLYVWDVEGNKYLDFFAGILTTSVGHNHPKVTERVREQVGKLVHSSTLYPHENHVNLAEKLARLAPGDLQVSYFTNSGTEANENAVMLAKAATGHQEVIALRRRPGRLAGEIPTHWRCTWQGSDARVEMVKDRQTKEPADKAVLHLFEETKRRGLLIGKGGMYNNTLRIAPPLTATEAHIDEALNILDHAFAAVQETVG